MPCQTLAFLAINQSLPNKLNSPHSNKTIKKGTKTNNKTDKNIHHVLVLCVEFIRKIDWFFISKLYTIYLFVYSHVDNNSNYFFALFLTFLHQLNKQQN